MNKRFASFLLTGKVAALPLFAQESLGAIQDISSKNATLKQIHESLDAKSATVIRPLAHERDKTLILPHKFIESHMPQIMNLVINGLHSNDEVMVVITHEKTIANLKKINPRSLAGLTDGIILNHFSVSDTPLFPEAAPINKKHKSLSSSKISTKAISLPIDLNLFSQIKRSENIWYLHVFVAKNSQWDKSIIHYSDTLELKSIDKSQLLSQYTEDCTVYSCP
jgi:hypothetical protein